MTIYKIAAHVVQQRFMEPPYRFTQEMHVIADSLDQAFAYVRTRFPNGDGQEATYESLGNQKVMALFDCRETEERIIV